MFINYSDIAGHQNLFLDYMYEFDNVEKFYKLNFRDKSLYPEVFSNVSLKSDNHRKNIVRILKKQYNGIKPSKQTEMNIESLKLSKTVAVVTGQQLGIYGGPLYTIYKIFTAIKLCTHLKENFEKYNFVPVFWLEGDDHDFDEIKSINLIDNNSQLVKYIYDDGLGEEASRGSVGRLKLTEHIEELNDELATDLRDTDFKNELMELLNRCYSSGKSISKSFSELLFSLFDEYGLIIFNPQDSDVKKMLRPVFEKEIENFRRNTNISVERSAELEEIYHAQVKVKPLNIFISDESGRYLLEPVEDYFRLKGKRRKWSKREILDFLQSSPESFSPNVILRPICQDYLFPTGVYVGGPGEINYFAQVIPFYNEFELPQPILYPRASASIVEKNISGIINKFELKYNDLFIGENYLNAKMIEQLSEIDLNVIFSEAVKETEITSDKLKAAAFSIDPTLQETVEKTKLKMIQAINGLQQKTEKAQERKHETTLRQIKKAEIHLFPEQSLQERKINFIYFANKYGLNILKWIFNEISINKFEHQILEL